MPSFFNIIFLILIVINFSPKIFFKIYFLVDGKEKEGDNLNILLKYRVNHLMKLPRSITQNYIVSTSPNPPDSSQKKSKNFPASIPIQPSLSVGVRKLSNPIKTQSHPNISDHPAVSKTMHNILRLMTASRAHRRNSQSSIMTKGIGWESMM